MSRRKSKVTAVGALELVAARVNQVQWVIANIGIKIQPLGIFSAAPHRVSAEPPSEARRLLPVEGVVEPVLGVEFHPGELVAVVHRARLHDLAARRRKGKTP